MFNQGGSSVYDCAKRIMAKLASPVVWQSFNKIGTCGKSKFPESGNWNHRLVYFISYKVTNLSMIVKDNSWLKSDNELFLVLNLALFSNYF